MNKLSLCLALALTTACGESRQEARALSPLDSLAVHSLSAGSQAHQSRPKPKVATGAMTDAGQPRKMSLSVTQDAKGQDQ